MAYVIQPVVEGHGELRAVPAMLEKWLKRRNFRNFRVATRTIRTPGSGAIKAPARTDRRVGVERWVELARDEGADAILVIVDADEDCLPARPAGVPGLGPSLRARAEAAAGGVPVAVVVANREFESWLLAHERPFRRYGLLPPPGGPGVPFDVDTVPNAKAMFRAALGADYEPRRDQAAFASRMSFSKAAMSRSRSLRKLDKELMALTMAVRRRAGQT